MENNIQENHNRLIKKIIIVLVSLLVIFGLFIGVKAIFNNIFSTNNKNELLKNSSFFLKNNEGKYALFNKDGKKITDFIFLSVGNFAGEAAEVKNEKKEYGIISQNGKMIVDFGEYEYVFQYGPIFKISSHTDTKNETFIINSKGQKIWDVQKEKEEPGVVANGLILEHKEKYDLIDINGKVIYSFKKGDNSDEKYPDVQGDGDYIVVNYNGEITVVNYVQSKKIVSFKDSGRYCVNSINEKNTNQIIVNKCYDSYEKNQESNFKLIENDKIKFEFINKYKQIEFEKGFIIGYEKEENNRVFLNEKGEVIFKNDKNDNVIYNNPTNYAIEKEEGNVKGVEIYKDGKLSKFIPCTSLYIDSYTGKDIYPLYSLKSRSCPEVESGYKFYNSKAEVEINEVFAKASSFDKHGIAILSKDKIKYYLIDSNGRKISNEYNSITVPMVSEYKNRYYIASDKDKSYILNTKGEVILEGNLKYAKMIYDNQEDFVEYKNEDDKYTLYDIANKKIMATSDKYFIYGDNYITAFNDNKIEYYLSTGKKIYEESK